MLESTGARTIKQSQPITEPTREEAMPTPRAFPALPCWARGKPSKQVATEAGVPGILSMMAETKPPEMPPT